MDTVQDMPASDRPAEPQLPIVQLPSEELLQTIARLFNGDFDPKGLAEDRAVQGLAMHLQPGESLLMANTVKMRQTGCLAQFFKVGDNFYSVAVTDQRVLLARINFLKPSKNAKIFPYDQLAGMFTKKGSKGRYFVLESKNNGVFPLYAPWLGGGPGAEDFLKAMFAHFYMRARQIVVPPAYADSDVKATLSDNQLSVLIG